MRQRHRIFSADPLFCNPTRVTSPLSVDDLQLDVQRTEEPIGVNVVGVLPGRRWGTPEDKLLIIGAHYDTVTETPGRHFTHLT